MTDDIRTQINQRMMQHLTWHYYRLEGHTPVPMTDLLDWAMWFAQTERHVGHDWGEGWELSTVFLGQDLRVFAGQPMELFETMLFVTGKEPYCLGRFATWEEAAERHACWLSHLRLGLLAVVRALEPPYDE